MIDKLTAVRVVLVLVLVATLGCAPTPEPESLEPPATKTMKVFILAGQSNMGNTLGCHVPHCCIGEIGRGDLLVEGIDAIAELGVLVLKAEACVEPSREG